MSLPPHLSYSALNTYEDCPRAWYLGRVKRAEARQTWFFPVGTTVHQCIEHHIAGEPFSVKEIFYALVREQLKIDPDDVNWLAGGSAEDPSIRGKALAQAEACVEEAVKFLEKFTVFEVEYDASGMLPGCEVPIKAYVDLIGEHEDFGYRIVDWKTGKSKPKSTLQLEVYGALINFTDHPFNEHASLQYDGYWGMVNPLSTSKTPRSRKVDLSGVDPEALGLRFQAAYDNMKRKLYKANPDTYKCKWCIQAPNCNVESLGSARAKFYDKSSEDGYPF